MASQPTASARAHSNIALAKYWGKRDSPYNLPAVGSISVTLEALYTETTVRFDDGLSSDRLTLDDRRLIDRKQNGELHRVSAFLDLIRQQAGIATRADVVTRNNFPTRAGLASSASGFAALAMAATAAAGLEMPPRDLSRLARRGSGSAARSIYGGFVEMHAGQATDGRDAYAEPLAAADGWPLTVLVAVTDHGEKSVGSTAAMLRTAQSSPYYGAWVASSTGDLDALRAAVREHDFVSLSEIAEHSCLKMHGLMLSARPGILYWNAITVAVMHAVRALREGGVRVFFTIDAGPQVKAVCEPDDAVVVADSLESIPGVQKVLRSGLGPDAHLLETRHCK